MMKLCTFFILLKIILPRTDGDQTIPYLPVFRLVPIYLTGDLQFFIDGQHYTSLGGANPIWLKKSNLLWPPDGTLSPD